MTKEQRNEVRSEAKKNGGNLDLAALKFLGISPDEHGNVPEGNKGAVYNIRWEVENVKD